MRVNKLLLVIIGLLVLRDALEIRTAHAQNPALTPWAVLVGATILHTNCTPTAGYTTYCHAGDGVWESDNGGAFYRLGAAGVQKVNDVAPGPTGNVTISCSSAGGSVVLTPAAITSGTTLQSLATPGAVYTAPALNCTGSGS